MEICLLFLLPQKILKIHLLIFYEKDNLNQIIIISRKNEYINKIITILLITYVIIYFHFTL